ncbi:hypothetical protein Q1695_007089 [Nippostrongylus brasiliensis]|nr:hypothetical protein Q1695_007089 [Nippostrongylus brasiliensis]
MATLLAHNQRYYCWKSNRILRKILGITTISALVFIGIYLASSLPILISFKSATVTTRTQNSGPATQSRATNIQHLQHPQIAIVTVVNAATDLYKTALQSVKCYAYQNDYAFLLVNSTNYKALCPQRDFFFQRHCITAHVLANNNYSWVLFLDSDIGVVNENRTIEEYIRKDADIIFYDRFFNFEIMAGAYLAKKSPFATDFLHGWANFEKRLSMKFSGTDNGAIHIYMTEVVAPNSSLLRRCWKMYNNTVDHATLRTYSVCCREAMKNISFKKIFVYKKGKGWARDSWLSNSHWNPEMDFMFHSMKESTLKKTTEEEKLESGAIYGFMHTLRTPLDLDKCRKKTMRWDHEPRLIVSAKQLQNHLDKIRKDLEKEYESKLHLIYT